MMKQYQIVLTSDMESGIIHYYTKTDIDLDKIVDIIKNSKVSFKKSFTVHISEVNND